MIRFVSWGLPILLLCGGVAGVWMSQSRSSSAPSADAAAAEQLRLREAEDEVLLQTYEEIVDRIVSSVGRRNLTQDQAQQLKLTEQFLSKFTERYVEDHRTKVKMQLIAAHRQLGMIHLLLRDYLRSESALRDSQRIANVAAEYSPQADLHALQALNDESIGWTLAVTYRWAEAERLTASSVDRWEQLIHSFPDYASLYSDLSIGQRNLAMIRDVSGGDGIPDAEASVASALTAMAKSERDANSLRFRYETLIDSEQFLGLLYWQHGRLAEAEQICRSSIDHLQELLVSIESLFESNHLIPQTELYREAMRLARHNLKLVRRNGSRETGGSLESGNPPGDSDCWQWKLLKHIPGQILPIDLVVHGNRFPGEFEPQDALLLSWQQEWTRETVTSIIRAVHRTLPVLLVVDDVPQQQAAKRHLKQAGVSLDRILFRQFATNTAWIRDYGPLSVRTASGTPRWIDSAYTYSVSAERFQDDALSQALSHSQKVSTVDIPIHLQGGALLSNGAGLCLVSTDLIDRNQRLGMGKAELTGAIQQYFGAEQVVYLEPLIDEPTRHVDWFCAFTSPETIVVGEYGTDDPVNRDLLDSHARQLARLDTPGGKLKVVRIPMPPRAEDYFGGSYTNVIFANGTLVVPTWPEASADLEQQVLEQYQQLLPDWNIVPVPSRRLGLRGGGPRCCSMNLLLPHLPRGMLNKDAPGT